MHGLYSVSQTVIVSWIFSGPRLHYGNYYLHQTAISVIDLCIKPEDPLIGQWDYQDLRKPVKLGLHRNCMDVQSEC